MTDKTLRVIKGVWTRDQLKGRGTIQYIDGRFYDGNFENGLKHGYGTMTFSDGRKYEGNWFHNLRSGLGTLTWHDGSFYHGKFQYGMRNGFGVMIWIDGRNYNSYCGEIARERWDESRIMNDPKGRRYEGHWFKDKR